MASAHQLVAVLGDVHLSRGDKRIKEFKPKGDTQKKRRQLWLKQQKEQRQRRFDIFRGIVPAPSDEEGGADGDGSDDDGYVGVERAKHTEQVSKADQEHAQKHTLAQKQVHSLHAVTMDTHDDGDDDEDSTAITSQATRATEVTSSNGGCRAGGLHANQLMQPEHLEQVPEDAASEWFAIVCPKGERLLVIAAKGVTRVYSESGKCLRRLSSNLPGGSRSTGRYQDNCALDVIYVEADQTYHVVDMLLWQGLNILDNSASFRSFWIQSKWAEEPDLHEACDDELATGRFIPLSPIDCTREALVSAMQEQTSYVKAGVLLFHNEVSHQHFVVRSLYSRHSVQSKLPFFARCDALYTTFIQLSFTQKHYRVV
eukprot:m.59279 g.59279  ORF g.59279 m.59279 type:complete len:370 (-) comp11763_c0_seq2:610-1719(-)